jgi:hypothetical protein
VRLLVIAAIVAAAPAYADDTIADARRLEASLEYEQGLAMVERVIAHGDASPDQLAELHLLAGRLAAGLDRAAVAEDHFARSLAIRPDATLPAGTSPKLTAPFEAGRARSEMLAVTVTLGTDAVSYAPQDPLGLIVGIELEIEIAGKRSVIRDARALRIELPAGASVIEERGLDEAGNRAWVHHRVEDPVVIVPPPPPIVHREGPSLFARWPTWAIAGGVALVAGGVSAWRFTVDQNEWNRLRGEDGTHDFSQLQALETRGRQWGIAADISFGVAGAAAIAGVAAWLTHRDEPSVIVGPSSIGVAGRF